MNHTIISHREAFCAPMGKRIRIEKGSIMLGKKTVLFCLFSIAITLNAQNPIVPAGVYIYSLVTTGKIVTRKMLLVDGRKSRVSVASSSGRTNLTEKSDFKKAASSGLYTLEVTGENITTYTQQDLEITGSMTVDVTIARTVTDIDGNVYQTVKIGDQWWMAENLKVTHYCNGDPISNVTDGIEWMNLKTGAFCNYLNNASLATRFGLLYNWYAVNDSRLLAPADWHVPTDEEWIELEMHLGMSPQVVNHMGHRGTDEGGKLKETGTQLWMSPNAGATNESGFTALPVGYRDAFAWGLFDWMYYIAYYWSSTEYYNPYFPDVALSRSVVYDRSEIYRMDDHMQNGYSVRCVRN